MYRWEITAAVARTGNNWPTQRGRWRSAPGEHGCWGLWLVFGMDRLTQEPQRPARRGPVKRREPLMLDRYRLVRRHGSAVASYFADEWQPQNYEGGVLGRQSRHANFDVAELSVLSLSAGRLCRSTLAITISRARDMC
jgi:hypothetical protein